MATTTNYGWTTPDDTSLVKDGASAIRTLGSSIDTSLNNALGTKKAGLVLLNTTSFSAVSSVSLAASTFTSTYDNYKVIYKFTASGSAALRARVRLSGTDASGANYSEMIVTCGTGSGPGRLGALNTTEFDFCNLATSNSYSLNLDFYDIAKAAPTGVSGFATQHSTSANIISCDHSLSTAYDSFTIYSSSGAVNITGAYFVYGFNK
jgi:hypothetical protein